jgi:serine-type D-Ala-D-Ala carboxypeptidase/endopeptidase (penicillin-binding protein 4)
VVKVLHGQRIGMIPTPAATSFLSLNIMPALELPHLIKFLPSYSRRLPRALTALVLTAVLAIPAAAAAAQTKAAVSVRQPTDDTQHRPRRHARKTPRTVVATHYTRPRGELALVSDLHSLMLSRVRSGRWGVMVVSLTRHDTLYAVNPDEPLQPASNMKLYTSALALDQFGAAHQFSTDVLRDGRVGADGILRGNLIIRGDGDPALSKRFVNSAGGPMDVLAQLVANAGIRRVTGTLVADASAFDTQRIPEGWQTRYLQSGYAARISALSLNENLVTIVVRPGNGKTAASVTLDPATTLPLSSSVHTVAGKGARIIARTTSAGVIEVKGSIGARAGQRSYQLVVEDPTAFAAGAFRRALRARGISIDGTTTFAVTPRSAVKVTGLPSPSLSQMLDVMNGESINHYAELLFRDAGRHAAPNAVGSVESGNRLLQQFMTRKVGAAPGAVFAADGSGLSILDHVTPRSLVQLLGYADHAPWSDAFHTSLPIAGQSELLRHRMRSTPAQGNLHAKTGTTNSVISLGGYVTSKNGEMLAFAFIYNGGDRWNAKSTIDAMGATLAGFQR